MRKAAFLDRDGVINADTGYVYRPQDFVFLPGVFAACRQLMHKGYAIVIVTNQSGIARGYYTEEDYQRLTHWMLGEFQREQVEILDVRYCPYHPVEGVGHYKRESMHRKPHPQMILDAIQAHAIEPARSFMAGDNRRDIEAGRAAGLQRLFLIGQPTDALDADAQVVVYPDLLSLADDIV